jgi:hypothetical protein
MRGIRTTTWQRQWGGGVLIHGAETRTIDGKLFSLTTYRNGKKNGPCVKHSLIETSNRRLVPTADPTTNGQYVEDEKDGVWTETFNGQKTVTTWHNGKQVAP